MTTDKTGGPAFPSPGIGTRDDHTQYQRDGMTLWDWYAGQALIGLASTDNCLVHGHNAVARWSANYAEAMIAERKKRGIA